MAGIRSTLEADFSDFVTETQKANAALGDMEREATEVSSAVTGTATSMGKLGGAATSSASGFTTLSTGLRTADKTLGAFGVQIGPQISAIEEMGQVAGKTAAQIGKIGTAVAIAGAATAGWQIGRTIAELTGADKKVADFAAEVMGWGSASRETAGAQADLIARAREFGYVGNDFANAAVFMDKAIKAQQETFNTGAVKVRTYTRELQEAKAEGLPGLRKEIDLGVMSLAEMARHYGVSTRAVQYLQGQMAEEAATRKESERTAQAQAEAMAEVTEAGRGQSAILATLTDAQREATEAALAAEISQSTVARAYGLTAQQVRAVAEAMKTTEEAVKAFDAAQKIADATNREWNEQIVTRSATTTQQLVADIERWRTDQIAALDATGGATEDHYAQIAQIAGEQLALVKVDWDVLKEGQIATYADLAARAEATYQHMVANSSQYSKQAIADAQRVRDETLITFEEMSQAHGAAYAEFLKRDRAYADALKQFQDEAANAQEAAYQKETAALDRAIAYSQAYGVTIDAAKVALGQMGDAGEQAGTRTAQAMEGAAKQVAQVGMISQQTSAQMDTLAKHYQYLAEQNKRKPESGLFWSPWEVGMDFERLARETREKAGQQRAYESAVFGGESWGGRGTSANTLTVTVNNTEAQNIAEKLMSEMRRSGVRFG